MESVVMDRLFNGVYKGKKVLLTGHTGFKGSWLSYWLQKLGAEVTGFSLQPNSHPSHSALLPAITESTISDIGDFASIESTISQWNPDIVFHLAAQPLVRKSYVVPIETFHTNIIGTVNLYEAIRNSSSVKALVSITTDKVYRNKEWVWGYRETDTLGGHDPYSTSKACVELVHECYKNSFFRTKGIFSAVARAGNVIGGGDWSEDRLIPDIVVATAENKEIGIRNFKSIRPWQHVLDPLSAYLYLGQQLLQQNQQVEDVWNFGPAIQDCISVEEILQLFKRSWDEIRWKDASEANALHETTVLRLDCSKAYQQLKWKPIWGIDMAVERTAKWYKNFYQGNKVNTEEDINLFVADAKKSNAVWSK
jgi:CDP-glucose 4,6-dehydratase